jgi:hypothetical protein
MQGFQVVDKEHPVCRLVKALYILKQFAEALYRLKHALYIKSDKHLTGTGIRRNPSDPNLYFKCTADNLVILLDYVNDTIIMRNEVNAIQKVKTDLCLDFDITDLGLQASCIIAKCKILAK